MIRAAGGVPVARTVRAWALALRTLRGVLVKAGRDTLQVARTGTGVQENRMTSTAQLFPYPAELEALVHRLRYRPGWEFNLTDWDRGQGSQGLTLIITTCGYDSYHPDRGETYRVNHYMPVPPASFNQRSWQNWLFEQILLVEKHEAMEFFALWPAHCDGELFADTPPGGEDPVMFRPYAPAHGPGNDPYLRLTHGTDLDRRTRYTGQVSDH